MDVRPPCTCEKSECLQRYCHCFEGRHYCTDECSCRPCRNTEDNADEVDEHADSILKKRPDAFKPKVIAGAGDPSGSQPQQQQEEEARVHVKGCNCRKSECKKLYCECFKHQVGCTAKCQCIGCANKFGVKGADEADDDSPTGTSSGSGATFTSSDGALSAVDGILNVPADKACKADGFLPNPVLVDLSDCRADLVPQARAMGGGGLQVMFQQDGDNFQHNVDPQRHQGFAQDNGSPSNDANSVLPQDPSTSDTCRLNHDNQIDEFSGSGATFAGSDGASPAIDGMFNVLADQSSMVDDFSLIPVTSDWSNLFVDLDPQTRAMGAGGLEAFFQHFKGRDNFQHNSNPQSHQEFVQVDGPLSNYLNSVLQQDPSNSESFRLNHDNQINKFGGL